MQPKSENQQLSPEVEKSIGAYGKVYYKFASGFEIDLRHLENLSRFDAGRYSSAMMWIYLTHAPNELDRIYRNLDHSKGFYQFSQVAQILSKLTGRDFRYDLAAKLPNVGTYITLPGASYLDFGVGFGLMFAAAIGLGLGLGCPLQSTNRVHLWPLLPL